MSALTLAMIAQLAATPACSVPGMVPAFWPAVVRQESGYDPLALHDDTTSRAHYPASADAAEALAIRLMAQGHSVGVGLSQLTASSPKAFFDTFGLTIREALDPCRNMKSGAGFYVERALRIYHTGSPDKGRAYAETVVGQIRSGPPQMIAMTPPAHAIAVNRHASDTEVWE
jgi:type IV secretion system protein VirB1